VSLADRVRGWASENRRWLVAVALGLILLYVWRSGIIPMSEIGYLTGTQGLQAEFAAVYFNRSWYSATEAPNGRASKLSFGYEMVFDPDDAFDGYPDLCATQQPMLVDADAQPTHYSWSVDKGVVTLPNGTVARKYYQFEMWRYRLTWRVNIWLSGTEQESADWTVFNIITNVPDYGGTQIWIRLVPKNFVYFKDNPDELYIAPAYIGLNAIEYATYDKNKQMIVNDPDAASMIDLIPKARGETLGIYYARGGAPTNLEDRLLSYRGVELDPQVFRNEYWIKIELLRFAPKSWFDYQIWHNWKYPSVQLEFTVYVFVVGRWTVYLREGEVPSLEPHTPITQTGNPIADFFGGLADWWARGGWAVTSLLLVLVGVIAVAALAPGLLAALAAGLAGRGRR